MPVPDGPLSVFKDLHTRLKGADVPHAAIGGWAAIAWGAVRTTRDVDLLIDLPARRRPALNQVLSAAANSFDWRDGGEDAPVPQLLRLEKRTPAGAVPIDCIVAVAPADVAALGRRVTIALAGWDVPVLRPEDLIAMKLAAGGPVDLQDARAVYSAALSELDRPLLEASCRARKVLRELRSLDAPLK